MGFSYQVIQNWQNGGGGCNNNNQPNGCGSKDGCNPTICPDFVIKRYDTQPSFKVAIEDCDGPIDLTGLIVEASMWAKARLKANIGTTDINFQVAGDIGFEQMMVGDIIIMHRARLPEHMLITGFDETNRYVQVQRGYNGTIASAWKKGSHLRIVKMMNAPAESQMVLQDVTNIDGRTNKDTISDSFLVYQWQSTDVCLPGCYYMEFKLIKMLAPPPTQVPGSTVPIPSVVDYGCGASFGVEWMRRYPVSSEGYIIHIYDSITGEFTLPAVITPVVVTEEEHHHHHHSDWLEDGFEEELAREEVPPLPPGETEPRHHDEE